MHSNMMKVGAYFIHASIASIIGFLFIMWFDTGGYGEIAWLGFICGVALYFASIGALAFLWISIVGEETNEGGNDGLGN